MIETLAAMVAGGLLGALVMNGVHQRVRRETRCGHCWHWMLTANSGHIVYQHCCQCGAVVATHVVGMWGDQPWRYSDHGPYITYKAEVDYRNKTA